MYCSDFLLARGLNTANENSVDHRVDRQLDGWTTLLITRGKVLGTNGTLEETWKECSCRKVNVPYLGL